MSYERKHPVPGMHEPVADEDAYDTDVVEDPAVVRRHRAIMAAAIGAGVLVFGGLVGGAAESMHHAADGVVAHDTATLPIPTTTAPLTSSPGEAAPTTTATATTTTMTETQAPATDTQPVPVMPDFAGVAQKGCGVVHMPDGTLVLVGFTSPKCFYPGETYSDGTTYADHAPVAVKPGTPVYPICEVDGAPVKRDDGEIANNGKWIEWSNNANAAEDNGPYYFSPLNLVPTSVDPC